MFGCGTELNGLLYAQRQIAQAKLGDQVSLDLKDYRDVEAESFDKSARMGMFEHVGRVRKASGWQKFVERKILGLGTFGHRYIFPDGELTPVSEINTLAEAAGFEVRDVENLRAHYALTLRHWVNRLEAHQAEAIRAADEVTYRTCRRRPRR